MVSAIVMLIGKNYNTVCKTIAAMSLGILTKEFVKKYFDGRTMGRVLAESGQDITDVYRWRKQWKSKE